MRVLSTEHAAELQLIDLSRLERECWLLFGAGKAADELACEYLAEIRRREVADANDNQRKAA